MESARHKIAYIAATSKDDPDSARPDHNPADFIIKMPNSTKMTGVSRICYSLLSVPNMFYNIDNYNNEIVWWQRQIIEPPTGTPNTYLRTVATSWTPTKRLVLARGFYSLGDVLAQINAVSGPDENWTYNGTVSMPSVKIETDVSGVVPVAWGVFVDGAHVDPPVAYANMTYITAAGKGLFDTLGIQRAAGTISLQEDAVRFDPTIPGTFDSTRGSNLESDTFLPLFDRDAHNYTVWSTQDFKSPPFNTPNMNGPTQIYATISEFGNSSTIRAKDGTAYDVLTAINVNGVQRGMECVKQVEDGNTEGVNFNSPLEVTQFRFRLLNKEFQQLTLPRNYPVSAHIQVIFTSR